MLPGSQHTWASPAGVLTSRQAAPRPLANVVRTAPCARQARQTFIGQPFIKSRLHAAPHAGHEGEERERRG